ncbi:MAG: WecB/TagA/CpsF family glycosyltransferase [Chloroflexota bacterium]|nr:WecB/TagA/CpsF family glycosyltransferase [Chloroflexota bacterium]
MPIQHITQSQFPESVYILGVRVDRISQQAALDTFEQMIANHRASNNTARCQQIITVNPEFVMAAQHHTGFRTAINSAALVLADGTGVVWATRYLGKATPERVTGTDILPLLAQRCAAKGYRLYLLGAAPGIAQLAAQRLQKFAPGLEIAGTYAGSPAVDEEETIIERIQAAQADVLCVAYGAPAQEMWIYRNLSRLPVAVAIGVGGAFDFLSGQKSRAPQLMRKMGIEWVYRLYQEPWRWKRMLALPRFALAVLGRGRKKHDA